MKILVLVARILMGLTFLVFGVNHIYPLPVLSKMAGPTGDGGTLAGIMFNHGWFMVYGAAEAACGLLLLAGRFVPLALTILAAIGLNILLFTLSFTPAMAYFPLFLAILEVILIYAYRESFRGIFDGKAQPVWKA